MSERDDPVNRMKETRYSVSRLTSISKAFDCLLQLDGDGPILDEPLKIA
jgi:hypothetical protein